MRLLEAILDANHRALAGDARAGLRPAEHAGSLPLVALTCIDPRLNRLMPEVLGVPEEQFIWLRNAGNIIFDATSSMTRALALACAVKGGREIVIIGHTDCLVRRTSALDLLQRFAALGVDRARLPENLHEFFGLFSSERQNVLRGVGLVRSSPLIGPRVPVHGLLVDTDTGRLEWVVNGYETSTVPAPASLEATGPLASLPELAPFQLGAMHFPTTKIGEWAGRAEPGISALERGAEVAGTMAQKIGETADKLGHGLPVLGKAADRVEQAAQKAGQVARQVEQLSDKAQEWLARVRQMGGQPGANPDAPTPPSGKRKVAEKPIPRPPPIPQRSREPGERR